MSALFELVHFAPTKQSFLLQWPGRTKHFPKQATPTVLAGTKPGLTPALFRAMGPMIPVTTRDEVRETVRLTEEQALRVRILIELLAVDGRKAPSEELLAHVGQMSAETAAYWSGELVHPERRDRARRALALVLAGT